MKRFLLLFVSAILAFPAIFANEVYFYFQDGEEDDFDLDAPQTLVSIWNETDEENVPVPDDMAFMSYEFSGAKILRIAPNDFDYELVVDVDGNSDTYFLDKEDTEWYLTLLPEADMLEIYVRVYLDGQAPGQSASNVTMNFNIQAADGSDIANPGECVDISYFDAKLFQVVNLEIEDNYTGASVAPGTSFEIVPAEGYVVTDVMTYLPGIASISEPGDDETTWRVAVSYDPDGDFAAFFVTVDKVKSDDPVVDPADATITQIAPLQWKVEWTAYSFISQTDTDYFDNNAYITDSKGVTTELYANLHGDHENPAIIFPETGNYFTVNLGGLNLAEGTYTLTFPEGYVELGAERTLSIAQIFTIEVGKAPEVSYTVHFTEIEDNTFDIYWDNVTSLTPANTTGAYMRNVMTNKEYELYFLEGDLYSKCNIRIYNNNSLRVNVRNNYPDLPTGFYELYIPANYVKFNGTDNSNEAIDAHEFIYTAPWSEGEIEFDALLSENKLVLTWLNATEIAYNTDYKGDGQGILGITIFDSSDTYVNVEYPDDITIDGNKLTINIAGIQLKNGQCTLMVPEDCLLITVGGITDYTFGSSFRFEYGGNDEPEGPQQYSGEATWTLTPGAPIAVSWNNYTLEFIEGADNCSAYNPGTGLLELAYGTEVKLSDDKTKILIDLSALPDDIYRVNVPEACVYINVDGTKYFNTGTSLDNVAGVNAVVADPSGRITVVNLNGIVVLDTDNAADLRQLPRGVYIVGGKKLVK